MKKLVIIPGGFHPFHAGHKALYDAAREAFPSADVYIAATADTSSRPFPFEVKKKLARIAGVDGHRFIQVKSPFRAEEITQMYDPKDTQLIFVRSEKDQEQQPRAGGVKKDGTPGYLQPYRRNGLQPMNKHGYMAYLPTVQFGPGMTSATEIRAKWPGMEPEEKTRLVQQLYPDTKTKTKLADVIVQMMDTVIGNEVTEIAPVLGAAIGGAVARSAGAGAMGQLAGRVAGSSIASSLSSDVDEAVLVNDPDAGHQIRPDGGMGTWDETSLVSNLARKFAAMVDMVKNKNYTGLQYVLYNDRVVKNMVSALAEYEQFMKKQGRRAIARGREIDMSQTSLDEKIRMRMPVDESPDYIDEGDVVQFPVSATPPENYEQAREIAHKIIAIAKDETIQDPGPRLAPLRRDLQALGWRLRMDNGGMRLIHTATNWNTVIDPMK